MILILSCCLLLRYSIVLLFCSIITFFYLLSYYLLVSQSPLRYNHIQKLGIYVCTSILGLYLQKSGAPRRLLLTTLPIKNDSLVSSNVKKHQEYKRKNSNVPDVSLGEPLSLSPNFLYTFCAACLQRRSWICHWFPFHSGCCSHLDSWCGFAKDLQSSALYNTTSDWETGGLLEVKINLTCGLSAFVDTPGLR